MASQAREKDPEASSWYNKDLKEVPEDMTYLLKSYSKLPSDQVVPHVLKIREQAFDIRDYPCIGQFRFLVLVLHHLPVYPIILSRMRDGATFLDVGSGLGQDLRRLVADGAPSENTFGLDIDKTLVELGFELFRDHQNFMTKFIYGDIFEQDDLCGWNELQGSMDIIYVSAFFHLFELDKQKQAARILVRLSRPSKGSIIVGRQAGSIDAMETRGVFEGSKTFVHNAQSWKKFWEEVGEMTSTSWKVSAWLDNVAINGMGQGNGPPPPYHFEKKRRLMFEIERL